MTTFTNVWTEASPSDADDADTLGAAVRQLRIDIRERMNAIFGGTGWSSDPIVIGALTMGVTGLAKLLVGTTGLAIRDSADALQLLKISELGDLTLLRDIVDADINCDITFKAGHTTTMLSKLVVDAAQARVNRYTAATQAIDWNNGNNQYFLTTGATTFTFANPLAGAWYQLEVKYGGAHSLAWPTVSWAFGGTAPTPTSSAGKTDMFSFYYNGTGYIGFIVGMNISV